MVTDTLRFSVLAIITALVPHPAAADPSRPELLTTQAAQGTPEEESPVRVIGVEGDWRFECTPEAALCRMSTSAVSAGPDAGDANGAQLVAMIAPQTKVPVYFVHLPLGLLLEEDGALTVDGQPFGSHRVRTCQPGGCIAHLTPAPTLTGAFRKGGQAEFTQPDLRTIPRAFRFSLAGFTRTLERARAHISRMK